jgi:hypothetical protein
MKFSKRLPRKIKNISFTFRVGGKRGKKRRDGGTNSKTYRASNSVAQIQLNPRLVVGRLPLPQEKLCGGGRNYSVGIEHIKFLPLLIGQRTQGRRAVVRWFWE